MILYAICHTDGGRKKPEPMVRYIYPTKEAAQSQRTYVRLHPEYYPIRRIKLEVMEDE
jgi:hypothetical protein